MLDKLMNKLGYTKTNKLTYDYHLYEVAKMVGDPTEYVLSKELEEQFFRDLSSVDNINNFLDATMAKDMQREFSGDVSQRDLVHGAFARTTYLKMGIRKALDLQRR